MSTSKYAALDALQKLFSNADLLEIFEVALPQIMQKGDELQRHLAASAWEAAARIAHQMLGSANMYASISFNQMLRHIAQQDLGVINSVLFQLELKQALIDIITNIQDWIAKNKLS